MKWMKWLFLIFLASIHSSSLPSYSSRSQGKRRIRACRSEEFDEPLEASSLKRQKSVKKATSLNLSRSFSDDSAATTAESKPSPPFFAHSHAKSKSFETVIKADDKNDLDNFEIFDNVHEEVEPGRKDERMILNSSVENICSKALPVIVQINENAKIDVESENFWKSEALQIRSKYELPFRADLNGKTVVFDESTPLQDFDEFINNFLVLCESNLIFRTASKHIGGHFLRDFELEFLIDEADWMIQDGPRIRLHPHYSLAREIVLYFVAEGNVDVLKMAQEAGMNLNFPIFFGPQNFRFNLLHFCCRFFVKGSPAMIEALIKDARIDPNSTDSFGDTALVNLACKSSNFEMTMALLNNGADPNLQVYRQNMLVSAIHAAAVNGNVLFLKPFILFEGVDPNALTSKGGHLINFVLEKKNLPLFSDLLKFPRLLLKYPIVSKVFNQLKEMEIKAVVPFLDAFVQYLIKSKTGPNSHLQIIIFFLICSENLSALAAFYRARFDFNFLFSCLKSKNNCTPLEMAIRLDRPFSYRFLKTVRTIIISENELLLACKYSSAAIIEIIFESMTELPDNIDACLDAILETDNSTVLRLFIDKFGKNFADGLSVKVNHEKHPRICSFISTI